MTEPLDRCPRDSKLFQFTTRQLMRIAFLVLAVSFLLACTESNRLGEVQEAGADLPYFGPSSLEERIIAHQIVAKDRLTKTTSELVAATGAW